MKKTGWKILSINTTLIICLLQAPAFFPPDKYNEIKI